MTKKFRVSSITGAIVERKSELEYHVTLANLLFREILTKIKVVLRPGYKYTYAKIANIAYDKYLMKSC